MHLITPLGQALGHQVAGQHLLETNLGLGMDAMAQLHHLILLVLHFGQQFKKHGDSS